MHWTDTDRLAVATLRGLALDLPRAAKSGHTGTAMSLAPLGWLLYSRILRHDPSDPAWPDRDRLVMSNGHACVLLYGLLHLCGYALSVDDLKAFRKPGSRTPGHPESWVTPGIDASTGPLGQGLGMAVGMALAERFLASHFGKDLVDHYTYVLCSDGDLMEGVSSEASSFAGHQRLGKLICFYDDNSVTIDGPASLSWSESVPDRYRAYGWHVVEGCDGEDPAALLQAIEEAQKDDRPSLICVRTVIGFPSPGMQGKHEAHSPPFSDEEIARTKEVLGLDPSLHFHVPEGLYKPGHPALTWYDKLRHSGKDEEFRRWHERPQLTAGPTFLKSVATRVAGGEALRHSDLPNLVGGSADLAGSTCAWVEGPGHIRFGVREHAMAAICNGMAQHGGVLPFCSTYFGFSDYMKPALRLAALSRLPVTFLWTHDSLALGEDGPTHQPVEQLATLRALPNFWVFRPADAHETAFAWRLALGRSEGPCGLVLSRQTLPLLPPGRVDEGAYVVEESPDPQVTLLGSGAEVHLCLAARRELESRGVPTRVVSMPCWELFEAQPAARQREVLGPPVRVAVEAGASLGWHRWVGDRGAVLGLDRFGASGPGEQLMEEYGFTAQAVVDLALSLLS